MILSMELLSNPLPLSDSMGINASQTVFVASFCSDAIQHNFYCIQPPLKCALWWFHRMASSHCVVHIFSFFHTSSPSLQKFCKLKQTEWLRGEVARGNKCMLQITWGIENGGRNHNNASCSFSHTYMYQDIWILNVQCILYTYIYWKMENSCIIPIVQWIPSLITR